MEFFQEKVLEYGKHGIGRTVVSTLRFVFLQLIFKKVHIFVVHVKIVNILTDSDRANIWNHFTTFKCQTTFFLFPHSLQSIKLTNFDQKQQKYPTSTDKLNLDALASLRKHLMKDAK